MCYDVPMSEQTKITSYKTIQTACEGTLEEKKSRFIAQLFPVHSQEEAMAVIESVKKKYWDARHNCYAYILGSDAGIKNCSDDGEPSQTAGRPMMEVLEGVPLTDVACVVTRYFGGTLLGTGGLIRAYQGAVKEALKEAAVTEIRLGIMLTMTCDYNFVGTILRMNEARDVKLTDSEYGEKVSLTVWVPYLDVNSYVNSIIQATNGSVRPLQTVEKWL